MIRFELCCADIQSVVHAQEYKLDAIEFCTNLSVGGITPSIAGIKNARKIFNGELAILIRCRAGNFVYSALEKKIMLEDIQHAIDYGADTIVFGALNENNTIDEIFLQEVIDVSKGMLLCFHKAFDLTTDLQKSLDVLIKYQLDRVLSSGGKPTALEGINNLKLLSTQSKKKIEIMAGGSILSNHIHQIVKETGIKRIHAALSDRFQKDIEIVDKIELEKIIMEVEKL